MTNSRGPQSFYWLPQPPPVSLHGPLLLGLKMDQADVTLMWTSARPCSELNTATEERHSCIGKTEPLYSGQQQETRDFEFALLSREVATMVLILCPFALWNRNPHFHLQGLWGKEMRSLALGLSLLSSFEADEPSESQWLGISRGAIQEKKRAGLKSAPRQRIWKWHQLESGDGPWAFAH